MSINNITPNYYNAGSLPFKDLINAKFSKQQRQAISEFQVYKYLWRFKEKNGQEDLIKAHYYLEDLINLYDPDDPKDTTDQQYENESQVLEEINKIFNDHI